MPKRILIIDDDSDMLEMLHIIFQDSEYDVILSNTGMEYDEIKLLHPDLVLIDVNIKGYKATGDRICASLKSHREMNAIPVFLVSAEQNLDRIARDCNADGYFSKPFNVKILKTTVSSKLM